MPRPRAPVALALTLALGAGAAGACPVCDGASALRVRASIVDVMPEALAGVLAPFAACGAVVAVMQGRRPRREEPG